MVFNGIDIVEIDKIKRSMENPSFLQKVFSDAERSYFKTVAYNPQSVAATYAAKEAFSKAIGTGIRDFKLSDVSVNHNILGKPYFEFFGNAARIVKKRKLEFSLSLSHTAHIAVASVCATGEPMYKTVIFDLDGTLLDTSEGVLNSVTYALEKMGLEPIEYERAKRFLGPPLQESFEKVLGFNEKDIETAVEYYRENYKTLGGMYQTKVYDGIFEVLNYLKSDGRKLCVATLKPEDSAYEVLEHFKIAEYFDYIGANKDDKATKSGLVLDGLAHTGAAPDEAVLIGDTMFDLLGAKEAGVDFIFAGYGSVSDEDFPKEDCVAVCNDPLELVKHL